MSIRTRLKCQIAQISFKCNHFFHDKCKGTGTITQWTPYYTPVNRQACRICSICSDHAELEGRAFK